MDASVGVKWFVEESGTAKAVELLDGILSGNVVVYAPELLLYEVGNVLYKSKHFNEIEIAEGLELLDSCGLRLEQLNMPLIQSTIDFMAQYKMTFYDASYVALAYSMHIPLLSADVKGHKKIKEVETIEL
jgi:predicted nucleic acid-binding protein